MPDRLPERTFSVEFAEKGKAVLVEEDAPGVEPGRVLCRTLYTGLTNGTERNCLLGGNYCGGWPTRPGYQNVGRVIAVGDGAEGFAEGDLLFTGDFRLHQAYFNTDPKGLVIKLPDAVNPLHAALLGVAGVAMHDVRRAETTTGDRVLVVGAGPVGQFTAQAARSFGAHVTVVDLDEGRLAVATECGADRTFQITGDEAWAAVKEAGPYDIVFEDSGADVLHHIVGRGWETGLIRHRGKLVLIAGRFDVSYAFNAAQVGELTLLHASHFDRSDLELLCELTGEGVIRVGPVIKDVVRAADAVAIYDRLRDEPRSLLGTVFDWT